MLDCKIVNCDACSHIKLNGKHSKQMHQILRLLASMGPVFCWGRQRDRGQLLGKEAELRGGWVEEGVIAVAVAARSDYDCACSLFE